MTLSPSEAWEGLAGLLPDVVVAQGSVPHRLEGATAEGVLWQVAPGRFLLRAPDIAWFLVEDGCRVTIEPLIDDWPRVLRYLRMTPLAALLNQRGRLAYHAAAAVCEAGAVVLAGHSASGKSTVLGALLRRGWHLLADDLVVVSDDAKPAMVWPTFAELALWPQAARHLGYALADEVPVRVKVPQWFERWPRLLVAVCVLSDYGSPAVETRALSATEAFQALSVVAYNNHVAEAILGSMQVLVLTMRLAAATRTIELRRPKAVDTIDDSADAVIAAVCDE